MQADFDETLSATLAARADDRIVISGCSGGGKSTLISALRDRGYGVFEEPGRQVVREQALIAGEGLPWKNLEHFVELTVSRSLFFAMESLKRKGLSFFDRCPIDQVCALEADGARVPDHLYRAIERIAFNRRVFLVPPWPEIYVTDAERRHGFEEAEVAYHHLVAAYVRWGYDPKILPRYPVDKRVDLILETLAKEANATGLVN